jgi:teichuronic acid biosynthesis glycosyltransferase TuaG
MLQEPVSIIMPAYNSARFIEVAVASVVAQSHQQWEMLIVDDCSKDNTSELLRHLAGRDVRVRPILLERNGGPAAARNTALAAARHDVVAFLDSDDLWLPEKLSRQLNFMRERDAAISFTAFRRIPEEGGAPGKLIGVPATMSYRQLLCHTAIATSTVVVNRAKTGDFRMKKTYYDDFAAWLELLKRGYEAHGLDEDLMRYRVVGKSVSRNKTRSAAMVWRTYREIEKLSVIDSAWCFVNYGIRGWLKYRRF